MKPAAFAVVLATFSTSLATAEVAGPTPLAPMQLVPPPGVITQPVGISVRGQPALNCKKAPCTFPNVLASGQAGPIVETPIASDPGNPSNLIAGGVDYSCSPTVSTLQGYYVTTDGGKTWTQECGTVAPQASYGNGDPMLGYDLNGTVYRGGINVIISGQSGQWVIALASSTDHGMTWNTPVITTQLSGISSDKPWFASDNNANSPYKNSLYVSSTGFDSNSNTAIDFSRSTDGGQTWTTVVASPQAINPASVEASDIAVGANGTVYLAYLYCAPPKHSTSCAGGKVTEFLQTSTDGGATWSTPNTIMRVDNAPCPENSNQYWGCLPHEKYKGQPTDVRIVDYPAIAIDNTSGTYAGRLYAVAWNWTGKFMQALFSSSTDKGNTWSAPVPVAANGDDHDQFMPWVDVSTSGLVGVTWLDRRNDPKDRLYEAYAAVSSDGGATFPNYQLATKASNPMRTGAPGFLGDYRTGVWAGANKLLAVWPDTRTGQGRAEVGGVKN